MITSVKDALEAAKNYLWDGNGRNVPAGLSEYICYAAANAVKAINGKGTRHMYDLDYASFKLWQYVCDFVDSRLEGHITAEGLAKSRGINTSKYPELQAFRLEFIDELIGALEEKERNAKAVELLEGVLKPGVLWDGVTDLSLDTTCKSHMICLCLPDYGDDEASGDDINTADMIRYEVKQRIDNRGSFAVYYRRVLGHSNATDKEVQDARREFVKELIQFYKEKA